MPAGAAGGAAAAEDESPRHAEAAAGEEEGAGGADPGGFEDARAGRNLYAWSGVAQLKARLRELGVASYGDKATLWARLVKAEA